METFDDLDVTGDGVADSGIQADTDGDGVVDALLVDTNADGLVESFLGDTDYDGVIDSGFVDTDGDGVADSFVTYTDGISLIEEQAPVQPVEQVYQSETYSQWQESQGDGIHGDPNDASFWFRQNTGYTCGPASVAQIISDFTGNIQVDEAAVAAYAMDNGLLTPNGMPPDAVADLLDAYDVPSTVATNQGFDDLAAYLDEGRSVVMFVDAYDIWPAEDYLDEPEDSSSDAVNHFVRLVAIDENRGVAILADPGSPDGQGFEIPLAELDEAWDDLSTMDGERGRIAIVSDFPDPTVSGGALFADEKGFAAIPVTLATSRIYPALAE